MKRRIFVQRMVRHDAPCPACLDRDGAPGTSPVKRGALTLEGRPVTIGGALKGATKRVGVTTLSHGCEVCGGSGRVETREVLGDWPEHDKWVVKHEHP